MADQLLSRTEVQSRCGLGRSSLYRLMRAGIFPEPIRVGLRAVRWKAAEIEDYLESRPRATGTGPREAA